MKISCGGRPTARSTSFRLGAVRVHPRLRRALHPLRDRRPAGRARGDHEWFREELQGGASTRARAGQHRLRSRPLAAGVPLRRLRQYVEERRREPREDVLTGLAMATFPDGSLPEVIDVVRVAANLFSAGQETTVRLLGAALQTIGDRPDIQDRLREDRDLIADFVEECLRFESPVKGDFRLARTGSRWAGSISRRARRDGAQRRGRPRPPPLRGPGPIPHGPAQRHGAPGLRPWPHACPGGPLARARPVSASSGSSAAWATSGSPRRPMARPAPGATNTSPRTSCGAHRLHLEFTPIRAQSSAGQAPGVRSAPITEHRTPPCLGGSEVGEPDIDAFHPWFAERAEVVDEPTVDPPRVLPKRRRAVVTMPSRRPPKPRTPPAAAKAAPGRRAAAVRRTGPGFDGTFHQSAYAATSSMVLRPAPPMTMGMEDRGGSCRPQRRVKCTPS